MEVERIPGANRSHGEPDGWDANERGPVGVLPTRDEEDEYSGLVFMVSQYKPTPEELALLNAGGSIRIGINCHKHPVIRIPYVVGPGEI